MWSGQEAHPLLLSWSPVSLIPQGYEHTAWIRTPARAEGYVTACGLCVGGLGRNSSHMCFACVFLPRTYVSVTLWWRLGGQCLKALVGNMSTCAEMPGSLRLMPGPGRRVGLGLTRTHVQPYTAPPGGCPTPLTRAPHSPQHSGPLPTEGHSPRNPWQVLPPG